MVSARMVVLKKNARMQCKVPMPRIWRELKLTSAVCAEVPIMQAKYSLYSSIPKREVSPKRILNSDCILVTEHVQPTGHHHAQFPLTS